MQGAKLKTKDVAKYFLLPGIGPRVRDLFGSGFGYLAFLIATIFGIARLLPYNHPYLNPQNIGRFGLKQAIFEASKNLVWKKKHADQIIIFGTVILGMALLALQIVFLVYFMLVGFANAAPADPVGGGIGPMFSGSLFNTPQPEKDIAFSLLDRVFGVPGMFCNSAGVCTEVSAQGGGIPWPMHIALHNLFGFYSMAMLLVAVLIILYFIVVVVGETATTGTPFGQRFQNVWVPVRLVVAIGLLVPLPMNYSSAAGKSESFNQAGLNVSQYIVLYAAKMGSGFATNGWLVFNKALSTRMAADEVNPLGESREYLVGIPKPPSFGHVAQAMSLIHACAYAEWLTSEGRVPWLEGEIDNPHLKEGFFIKPYFVKENPAGKSGSGTEWMEVTKATTLQEAMEFFDNGTISMTFGQRDEKLFNKHPGAVEPTCGVMQTPVTIVKGTDKPDEAGGAAYVLDFYYKMVRDLWFLGNADEEFSVLITRGEDKGKTRTGNLFDSGAVLVDGSGQFVELMLREDGFEERACHMCELRGNTAADSFLPSCKKPAGGGLRACAKEFPGIRWKQILVDDYYALLSEHVVVAWQKYIQNTLDLKMDQDILKLGWGGAGIWYNVVARVNGEFVTALQATPNISQYPMLMEQVKALRSQTDVSTSVLSQFDLVLSEDRGSASIRELKLEKGDEDDRKKAKAYAKIYRVWNNDGSDQSNPEATQGSNLIRNTITIIFGIDGLFNIRGENAHVHPLAQLSILGRGMVESTIRNLAIATASSFMGGALGATVNATFGKLAGALGSFMQATAFLGLTAGVSLYYVLPFLPFIYFFFAIGTWVKTIFEAMVGAPLWALAHLRIDGEGLPGDAAQNGYFLILEIFLRPFLAMFGLVGSLIFFAVQVRILNFIWDLVTVNAAGFNDAPIFLVDVSAAPETQGSKSVFDKLGTFLERDKIDQFFFTIIYTIMVYMLGTASFKLIDQIPNGILRWMSSGATSFGSQDQSGADGLTRYVATSGMVQGQKLAGALPALGGGLGGAAGTMMSGVTGTPEQRAEAARRKAEEEARRKAEAERGE